MEILRIYISLAFPWQSLWQSFWPRSWAPSFVPLFIPLFPTAAAGVDLSLSVFFAAEDEGRTEEPTERKRQREREEGRVPKSPDIPASLVTLGGLVTLFFLGQWMFAGLMKLTRFYVGGFNSLPTTLDSTTLIGILIFLFKEVGIILAPIMGVAVLMAITGNLAQVGFMFTLKPLQPDLARIKFDFPTMVRKVFFSRQIAMNLIKTVLKVAFLGWISYLIISSDFHTLMRFSSMGLGETAQALSHMIFKLALILAVVLFLLALPDYAYQRYEFTESIKMTKEEVKQESRETEGDPLVKQRRRQKAYEFYRRNMLREVRKADVVITNPTHYAVALRYDPIQENAPRVLAKGEDNLAFIIRNLARTNQIPIIENKPLARELYRVVPEGELVPEQFYRVLIDIFVSIDSLRDKLAGRAG